MSGEQFGRLTATGEWGVCLLSSNKVRYPHNKNIGEKYLKVKLLSLDIKYMMFFGVTVHGIDYLRRKNKFKKNQKIVRMSQTT